MPAAQHPDYSIDGDKLVVLVNADGQYSIWPAGLPVPEGWSLTGASGPKETCLAYVESAWRDMRPRSLLAAEDRMAGLQ